MLGFQADTTVLHREIEVLDGAHAPSLTVIAGNDDHTERTPRTPHLTRTRRRGVGLALKISAVAIETLIVLFWLQTIVPIPATRGPKFFALLYVVFAMALLLPTYRKGRMVPRPAEILLSVTSRLALAPMVTAMLTLTANAPLLSYLDVRVYATLVGLTVASVMVARLVMFKVINTARNRGYDLEDTVIVGAGPVGVEVARALDENPEFGLIPCGFVERFDEDLEYPILGRPEDLPTLLEATGVRHAVLAFGATSECELVSYVRGCSMLPVQFYAVPRFFELGLGANDLGHELDGFALTPLKQPGHGHNLWPAKRAFDLAVSAMLIVLTSPILLACAAAVKLSSPGPVFFKQLRVGVNGAPFEIFKFRSMRVNDDSATTWSVDDDDRVTKVGAFLRKSHLDELPQLFNVLRGEMSIVGPRPERPFFVEQFSDEIDGYDHRHRVPAGITGWAQVNGFWGDTSIEARVRLDNRYIENWSLGRDLVIALRTVPTLLGKRR
jgi:exopolysaccharide biosynthesis polyprenyl glycosylphosphotransferase